MQVLCTPSSQGYQLPQKEVRPQQWGEREPYISSSHRSQFMHQKCSIPLFFMSMHVLGFSCNLRLSKLTYKKRKIKFNYIPSDYTSFMGICYNYFWYDDVWQLIAWYDSFILLYLIRSFFFPADAEEKVYIQVYNVSHWRRYHTSLEITVALCLCLFPCELNRTEHACQCVAIFA